MIDNISRKEEKERKRKEKWKKKWKESERKIKWFIGCNIVL